VEDRYIVFIHRDLKIRARFVMRVHTLEFID